MFSGLSSLRKAEKKEPTVQDKALQAYLQKQYGAGDGVAADEPKRKKRKKQKQGPSAIAIVDGDITGLAPVAEAAAKPSRPDLADAADSEGASPNPNWQQPFACPSMHAMVLCVGSYIITQHVLNLLLLLLL